MLSQVVVRVALYAMYKADHVEGKHEPIPPRILPGPRSGSEAPNPPSRKRRSTRCTETEVSAKLGGMRENPWHLRLPTTEHYHWFKNLVDLHELTTAWLKEVQADRPSHLMTRGLSREITENLWMLESLSDTPLEHLLDDTRPQDMLGRLEQTIWAVQAWTLNHLYGKTSSNRNALDSLLEQCSWRSGRACGETRWPELSLRGSQDLRDIILALNDSPFIGYPHRDGFLVRRAISTEILIELKSCPHQIHFPEVKGIADRLCRLHSHWMRGFGYSLNNRVGLEHVVQNPRCTQRWSFI